MIIEYDTAMENDTKTYIDEQFEKLAVMVAKGFENTATKEDIAQLKTDLARLEGKVDTGFAKRLQEHDELRDRLRLLETRVDKLEAVHP